MSFIADEITMPQRKKGLLNGVQTPPTTGIRRRGNGADRVSVWSLCLYVKPLNSPNLSIHSSVILACIDYRIQGKSKYPLAFVWLLMVTTLQTGSRGKSCHCFLSHSYTEFK